MIKARPGGWSRQAQYSGGSRRRTVASPRTPWSKEQVLGQGVQSETMSPKPWKDERRHKKRKHKVYAHSYKTSCKCFLMGKPLLCTCHGHHDKSTPVFCWAAFQEHQCLKEESCTPELLNPSISSSPRELFPAPLWHSPHFLQSSWDLTCLGPSTFTPWLPGLSSFLASFAPVDWRNLAVSVLLTP